MVDEKQTADMLEAERQAILNEVHRRVMWLRKPLGAKGCGWYNRAVNDVLALFAEPSEEESK